MSQQKCRRSIRSAVVASVALVLLSATAGVATATPPARAGSELSRNCVIVIAPSSAPGVASEVLSETCAPVGTPLATPMAETLLMTWHEAAVSGGASTAVMGSGGPCDVSGYGFAYVGDRWNDRIRSYRVFNKCTYSASWDHANWQGGCGEGYGDQRSVRYAISSMWVSSGRWAWDLCS